MESVNELLCTDSETDSYIVIPCSITSPIGNKKDIAIKL